MASKDWSFRRLFWTWVGGMLIEFIIVIAPIVMISRAKVDPIPALEIDTVMRERLIGADRHPDSLRKAPDSNSASKTLELRAPIAPIAPISPASGSAPKLTLFLLALLAIGFAIPAFLIWLTAGWVMARFKRPPPPPPA